MNDKEIINLTAVKHGYSKAYVEMNEESKIPTTNYYLNDDKLFESEAKIIKDLAKKSCIIVGRCADYVLRNKKYYKSIFIF